MCCLAGWLPRISPGSSFRGRGYGRHYGIVLNLVDQRSRADSGDVARTARLVTYVWRIANVVCLGSVRRQAGAPSLRRLYSLHRDGEQRGTPASCHGHGSSLRWFKQPATRFWIYGRHGAPVDVDIQYCNDPDDVAGRACRARQLTR